MKAFTVALIGPDGAGKTSIARRLEMSFPLPVKMLYMGINMESTNLALPTSRLVHKLKQTLGEQPLTLAVNGWARWLRPPLKAAWATLRLINRLAEEWYRQIVSLVYQHRGWIVVYDRYFPFDFEYNPEIGARTPHSLTDEIHRWCLAKLYPLPDLVMYLDAPSEVLFARKPEAPPELLEARRQAFLRMGKYTPGFVRLDASQPLDRVYEQVARHILEFQARGRSCTGAARQRLGSAGL